MPLSLKIVGSILQNLSLAEQYGCFLASCYLFAQAAAAKIAIQFIYDSI